MKMTAIEKHFVNKPSRTRAVGGRAVGLLSHINPEAGWRYLDVGCGVGFAATEIARATKLEVTGIDVDPKQIALAEGSGAGPNVHYRVMDATRLEFRDGEFDIVATSMMTHHIPNWEQALSEMVRVLRSGGYLIYSDHMFAPWWAKVGRPLIRFMGFPSARALESLTAKAGLAKVYEGKQPGHVDAIWQKKI